MNGTNELLRAILKIDEEERARTQATEDYRQKAQTDRSARAKQLEEEAMRRMREDVEAFGAGENERAQKELAGQQQRKEQILRKLDQQLVKNKSAWVETITARVLGRGELHGHFPGLQCHFGKGAGHVWAAAYRPQLPGSAQLP